MRIGRALSALAAAVLTSLGGAGLPAGLAAPAGDFDIVAGAAAEPGAWPAMAALARADEPDATQAQFCGGTLIDPEWVLTAAHCFFGPDGTQDTFGDDVELLVGQDDLQASTDDRRLGAAQVVLHPDFDAGRTRNDLALVRLAAPATQPPQLLADGDAADVLEAGATATVTGWGALDPEGRRYPTRLQQAEVRIRTDAACAQAYPDVDVALSVCAGDPGPSRDQPAPDTCAGDSGGPLLLPEPTGGFVQVGVTSFGDALCGVGLPGVYTRLRPYHAFIDAVVGGDPPAPVATSAADQLARVAPAGPTLAATQAVAVSRAVFPDGTAPYAVLARGDAFPDALAGSALGFGLGPLLYADAVAGLDEATTAELRRVLVPGAVVYVLGGQQAVPPAAAAQVQAAGFVPVRLAGATRESTAAAVARQVVSLHGDGPGRPAGGTVLVATSGNWPDAVLAGQLGARWGYPVLVTPPDRLHPAVEDVLTTLRLDRVLLIGGPAAVSGFVGARIDAVTGVTPERLGGQTRTATGVAVAAEHVRLLAAANAAVPLAVAVNVRADGAFSHALSATTLVGARSAVLLGVEGAGGSVLTDDVRAFACTLDGAVLGAGGPDVLTDQVLADLAAAVAGGAPCR